MADIFFNLLRDFQNSPFCCPSEVKKRDLNHDFSAVAEKQVHFFQTRFIGKAGVFTVPAVSAIASGPSNGNIEAVAAVFFSALSADAENIDPVFSFQFSNVAGFSFEFIEISAAIVVTDDFCAYIRVKKIKHFYLFLDFF